MSSPLSKNHLVLWLQLMFEIIFGIIEILTQASYLCIQ